MEEMLDQIKRRHGVNVTSLSPVPCRGPSPDWTGPDEPLIPTGGPFVTYLCGLLEQATQQGAKAIRFTLDQQHERTAVHLGDPDAWQEIPGLSQALWSGLVLYLPRISSIELFQGIITDPGSGDQWRLHFNKAEGQILLKKVVSDSAAILDRSTT